MTRWGKAGQRLDDSTRSRALRGYSQHIKRLSLERGRKQWAHGLVKPYAITWALDTAALYGPEVDLACGVEEPTVDQWEAGERYPTWEQLVALAELTGVTTEYFCWDRPNRDVFDTSSARFHFPDWTPSPIIDRYPREVIEEVLGV